MRKTKETLSSIADEVKSKTRTGTQAVTKSLLTLKDRAAANMEAFRRQLKK